MIFFPVLRRGKRKLRYEIFIPLSLPLASLTAIFQLSACTHRTDPLWQSSQRTTCTTIMFWNGARTTRPRDLHRPLYASHLAHRPPCFKLNGSKMTAWLAKSHDYYRERLLEYDILSSYLLQAPSRPLLFLPAAHIPRVSFTHYLPT